MAWLPWWLGGGRGSSSTAVPEAPVKQLTTEDRAKLARKCKAFISGLDNCRRANRGAEQQEICRNLEMRVVTCYACDVCKPEADEHRRCYTKVYKTGIYNGRNNCLPYEGAMVTCLAAQQLHPV